MHALPAAALAAPLTPSARPDALSRSSRHALTAGVLLIHGVAAWGLLQMEGVHQTVAQAAPVMVHWITPDAPGPAIPPPPREAPRPQVAEATRVATPVLAVPAAPTAAPFVAPAPATEPPASAVATELPTPTSPVATATASAPPSPPAPPAPPRSLPSSAIHYLVPPAVVVPTASRRLNEQGTVWLRLVVDTQGMPQQVSVHQSSGFRRLDDQALQAMRAARFKPYIEHGVVLEWTAIAPLAYELE